MAGGHYRLLGKLTNKEREELFVQLARAVASMKSSTEAAQLMTDLFTEAELAMVAKRLAIADLLIEGASYQDIRNGLKVSYGTIARISGWLQNAGEGYRLAVKRLVGPRERDELERTRPIGHSWRRRYPSYYWPQLLLEELIANANKRQREQIKSTLKQVKEKTKLHRDLAVVFKKLGY